jgi:hypothetical protein
LEGNVGASCGKLDSSSPCISRRKFKPFIDCSCPLLVTQLTPGVLVVGGAASRNIASLLYASSYNRTALWNAFCEICQELNFHLIPNSLATLSSRKRHDSFVWIISQLTWVNKYTTC